MTNPIDASPARLRELAYLCVIGLKDRDDRRAVCLALEALADEKESKQCSSLCHPEEPCSISADGACTMKKEAQPSEPAPELSMSMFASKEDYEKALAGAVDVPLPAPYAWRATGGSIWGHKSSQDDTPLFTGDQMRNHARAALAAQQKTEPALLTEYEIRAVHGTYYRPMGPVEYARAIEAAVLKKNGIGA